MRKEDYDYCLRKAKTAAGHGNGGFPLIWEQINGEGSCLWASEIEPFCVAVTKRRLKK